MSWHLVEKHFLKMKSLGAARGAALRVAVVEEPGGADRSQGDELQARQEVGS